MASNEEVFDIIHLIEKNPLTRLSKNYQGNLINKIKNTFTETQQHLFVTSFYCFLNYHLTNEFVVDFDNVWKWTGFSRKDPAKRLLEKYFTKDTDYIINLAAPPIGGAAIKGGSGLNKETILLNINTFKKFCMKTGTKKADEIHDYYIKLETLLQETMNEENSELREQLTKKEEDNKKIQERLDNFANRFKDKQKVGGLVYIGQNPFDKDSFKVGSTTNVNCRVSTLSTGSAKYFMIKKTWYTKFYKQIEDSIKQKFSKNKVTGRKEFYQLECYDNIVSCIDKLVESFNLLDEDNNEKPTEHKKRVIKNPTLDDKKSCTKCNVIKPLEDFFPASDHVDGKQNKCKECAKSSQAEYIENKRKTEEIPTEKQCSNCKVIKLLDQYYTDNNAFDKKGTKCKDCVKLVYSREKNENERKDIIEYKCSKCKITKQIDHFHSLPRSLTGHKYTCKECVTQKVKENYYKHREKFLNGDMNEKDLEKERLENRKKTVQESNARRKEIIIHCPCGTITNELNIKRHQQTAKHKKAIEKNK